jgi:Family of unknown function (DUF6263)
MRSSTCLLSCLLVAGLAPGCSSETPGTTSTEDQLLLDDMLGELDGGKRRGTPVQTVSGTREAAEPVTATAHGEQLQLRLRPGDRFPLIKTVEQVLVQRSATAPLTARTRLELTLVLQVEEVQPDFVQMNVRYSRVSYSHDLAGQRVEFDSSQHQGVVPQDAIPYAGMVNSGFSFQIGRDNRIQKLIGYEEFLQRCVQQIPVGRRQTLLAEIGQRFGDDGVANFIDDTIGLLPYNTDVDSKNATNVLVGDVWTRERRLMQPVPVHMTSTYRLVELNQRTAEIDITGSIAAGASLQSASTGAVRIHGGHAVGRCTVDRDTGLPLELNITQFVTLSARTDSGVEVTQEKQVVTNIRTFPEMRGTVVGSPNTPGNVVPASGGSPDGNPVQVIPSHGTGAIAPANYSNAAR